MRRRLLQIRCSGRGEILAARVHKSLPVLIRDEGQVRGRTYPNAQGLFAVRTALDGDGRVRLSLVPELHHGETQQHWTGQEGIFRLEMMRPRKVFDKLRLEAALSPGQMLVVSCLPSSQGSLGYHFFTDDSPDGREQKLLVVRLAQLPPQEPFVAE